MKLELIGVKFKQKDIDMILMSPTIFQIRQIAYVFRKSKDNREALERQLIQRKVQDIRDEALKDGVYFPNAIVINLIDVKKTKIEDTADSGIVKITMTLPDAKSENASLEDTEGKVGYIIDGQHRLEGLKEYPDFRLPVVMLINANQEVAFKTFADINENQDKVSKILLTYIKWELRDFLDEDSTPKAFSFVLSLYEDDDSPLKGKIRVFEDEKGAWVTSPTLTKLIQEIVEPGGPIQHLKDNEKLIAIKNYLVAWKRVFPEAWDESTRDKYVLTKAMGFTVMLRLFPRIYRRCDLYQSSKHTAEAFEREITPLKKAKLPIDNQSVALDWNSDRFGKMSSGKGIKNLTTLLFLTIPERGEPNI